MILNFYNTGDEVLHIEYNGIKSELGAGEHTAIAYNGDLVSVKLSHKRNDRFKFIWYLLHAISLDEQMRTVLVVDGIYTFRPLCDNAVVKVKSYEYLFGKDISYQTFIFAPHECEFQRNHLEVANGQKIYKRAKFLYLFGGWKTLLPISIIGLIIMLATFSGTTTDWMWLIGEIACTIILTINYIKSLMFLKKSLKEKLIFDYLSLSKKKDNSFSEKVDSVLRYQE